MTYSTPSARVICDSVSPFTSVFPKGVRLVTVQAKIHRFILAEMNTHRVFSRNSASSRAIPCHKLREQAMTDPAMPVYWGKNRPGMQADEEMTGAELGETQADWLRARDIVVKIHEEMEKRGLHKQLVNRILEPFLWHQIIITSSRWSNFFRQRRHPDAQPEMRYAANSIYDAMAGSEPTLVDFYNWHLPYTHGQDREFLKESSVDTRKAVSVGRCARVSYLNHEKKIDITSDTTLFDKLIKGDPGHWSPLEHVATPRFPDLQQFGNLTGWTQFRHSYNRPDELNLSVTMETERTIFQS